MNVLDVPYVLCLLIFATFLGKKLLKKFSFNTNQSNITAFAYGTIILSTVFTFLGLIGLLYKNALTFIFVTLLLIFAFKAAIQNHGIVLFRTRRVRGFESFLKSLRSISHRVLLVFLPLVFVYRNVFKGFLNPVNGYDALAYHIYAPLHALNYSHTFSASTLIPNAGLPLGYQAIYGWIASFTSMHAFALLNLCFIFLTLSVLYQGLKHATVFVVIAICYSVMGLIIFCGSTVVLSPTSDIALMFFSLLAIIQLAELDSDLLSHQQLFLHGLLIGFLPMIKPFAMVLVLPLLTIYLIKILKIHKASHVSLRKISTLLIGLLPYLVWSVKNYVQIGNPFYPMLQGLFRGSGYGPEVMTNEEDVRRSFDQLFRFLQANPFGGSSMATQHAQLAIFLVISIFSISGCFLGNQKLRYLFISTVLSECLLIVIIGPIMRYFLFISVIQIYLIAKSSYSLALNGNLILQSRKFTQTPFIFRGVCLSISLAIFTLTFLVKLDFDRVSNSKLPNLRSLGIDVSEPEFLNVVSYMHKISEDDPKSILLFGEGRAALFWPMNVAVYAAGRRNPFANPSINTPEIAMQELKLTKCDLFILVSGWGYAANINLNLISSFEQKYKSQLLYKQPGWSIYDIQL